MPMLMLLRKVFVGPALAVTEQIQALKAGELGSGMRVKLTKHGRSDSLASVDAGLTSDLFDSGSNARVMRGCLTGSQAF